MRKILGILFGIIFVVIGIFIIVRGNDMAKKCTSPAIATVVEMVKLLQKNIKLVQVALNIR